MAAVEAGGASHTCPVEAKARQAWHASMQGHSHGDGEAGGEDVSLMPLSGGFLNRVFHAEQGKAHGVVKVVQALHGPVTLTKDRGDVEARALKGLGEGELQELLAQRQCTVPVLLGSSTSKDSAVLVMEYLHPSEWQPLNEWWTAWEASDSSTTPCTPFSKVGQLHGVLHGSVTVHMSREPSPELSPSCFANRNIQEVRSVMQFSGAQAALAGTVQELPPGPRSALEAALRTACAFGAAFAGGAEGVCFTHGDAWLPSYMVRAETHKGTDASLAAIDWEFCHWGWPVQDVAHTFAHIWMHAHVWAAEGPRETSKAGRTPHHEAGSPSPVLAADSQPLLSTACPGAAAWQAYRQGYVAELSGAKEATSPLPFAPTVAGAAADQAASAVLLWAGTEVLARATGPFGFGFLYNPHASTSVSPLAADATHVAACMLLVAHWGGAAVELEEFPQHWHAGLRYASDLHEALGEQLATQDRP